MYGRRRNPFSVRAYRSLLSLLPVEVSETYRSEMVVMLQDHLADTTGGFRRLRVLVRAYRRLPGMLFLEWAEALEVGTRKSKSKHRMNGGDGMGTVIRNLRYAARTLRRSPTFTLTTTMLVALGVGAVTSVFTIVDHVLLRPLPYPQEERLVYMTNGSHNGATLRGLDDVDAFELWTASSGSDVNLTLDGADPLRLRAVEVTPACFTMFGARPLHGRLLLEGDYADISVAVLTHETWASVWGSDPSVVGSTVRIDGEPISVVGVLPESWVVPETLVGRSAQLFRPLNWDNPDFERAGYHAHSVAARLASGFEIEIANAQVDQLALRVAEQFPDYYSEGADSWPLVPLRDRTVGDAQQGLYLLLGAVGLLLMVACANIAHLFMARGLSRGREMAIRRALGAGTRILTGQLLVESLMVGILGGAGGLILAHLSLAGFARWMDALPRADAITLDFRVAAFAIALASLTSLAFGLLPALKSIGRDINDTLRQASPRSSSGRGLNLVRGGLVVGEVALSLVLVTLAGLLMRSFMEVTNQDSGFEAENVWVLQLNPTGIETPEDYSRRMDAIERSLALIPGVTSVSYGIEAPFEWTGGDQCCWSTDVALHQAETEMVRASVHPVSDGFFETYGTRLVAGSGWSSLDAANEPTPLVISEQLAVRIHGSADAALGREFGDGSVSGFIQGVAEPTLYYGLDQSHENGVYMPVEALPFPIDRAVFGLRTAGNAEGLVRQIREAVWAVEAELPVPEVALMTQWVDESSATRRFGSALSPRSES